VAGRRARPHRVEDGFDLRKAELERLLLATLEREFERPSKRHGAFSVRIVRVCVPLTQAVDEPTGVPRGEWIGARAHEDDDLVGHGSQRRCRIRRS
jgi:hypothetical protein